MIKTSILSYRNTGSEQCLTTVQQQQVDREQIKEIDGHKNKKARQMCSAGSDMYQSSNLFCVLCGQVFEISKW